MSALADPRSTPTGANESWTDVYASYSDRVLQTLVNAARMDTEGFKTKYFYGQGEQYACTVQNATNPYVYLDRLHQYVMLCEIE